MDLGLKGRIAVVLAASSGIGRGIATCLHRRFNRYLCARRITSCIICLLRRYGQYGCAECLPKSPMSGNASSLDTFFDQVFGAFGRVDILVNSSGGQHSGKSLGSRLKERPH